MSEAQELPAGWICRPDEIEQQIQAWAAEYGEVVSVDWQGQFCGLKVYAVTVGKGPRAMLSAVPHAHEPGGTAASMELLSQLITGESLTGVASELDRDRILSEVTLTVIPAGNPDGLARSPQDVWEGGPLTEFLEAMKGVDEDGELLPWPADIDTAQVRVAKMGIVYEQIGPTLWVEPNRSKEATLWKLIDGLSDGRVYHQFLHLHQGMEGWEEKNFWLEYPTDEWLAPAAAQYCEGWSETVLQAAAAAGARPEYDTGHYVQYRTRELWSENGRRTPWLVDWLALKQQTPSLTVEVQNNNPNTPAQAQRKLALAALVASVGYLMEQGGHT